MTSSSGGRSWNLSPSSRFSSPFWYKPIISAYYVVYYYLASLKIPCRLEPMVREGYQCLSFSPILPQLPLLTLPFWCKGKLGWPGLLPWRWRWYCQPTWGFRDQCSWQRRMERGLLRIGQHTTTTRSCRKRTRRWHQQSCLKSSKSLLKNSWKCTGMVIICWFSS